jgi:hypothetical protein
MTGMNRSCPNLAGYRLASFGTVQLVQLFRVQDVGQLRLAIPSHCGRGLKINVVE